jgi:putative periplasmic protein
MNNKLIALILIGVSLNAAADTAEDNLMNARSAYRAALKQQTGNDSKIISLQSDLEDAQYRLQKAQADIVRLQGELQAAMNVKSQQAETLRQAGQQLDSAWGAVYGSGGTKAGR